jgi:ElaB/YqjD/DUF883 family membrane-anchored ribosome-binding protein
MSDDPIGAARATMERVEGAARDSAAAVADTASDLVDAAGAFIEKAARERPVTTVATAAGVGLLLGLLLFGGRRD